MSTLRPCRHLDYTDGKFGPDIALRDCAPHYPDVKFWLRGKTWTDNGPTGIRIPAKVQFCGDGRGRINGIFQCYNGEMSCYQPTADAAPNAKAAE